MIYYLFYFIVKYTLWHVHICKAFTQFKKFKFYIIKKYSLPGWGCSVVELTYDL